ncbi:MAG: hypothetical protein R2911_12845 [Caldilineaceae bacterium]
MSGIPNVLIIVALVVVIIISAIIGLQLPNLIGSSQATQAEELNSQLVNLLIQERLNSAAAANNSSPTTGQAAAPPASVANPVQELLAVQPTAPADEPTAVASANEPSAPELELDYVFDYLPSREECTVATQLVVHLMESWGYHVGLDEMTTPDELYRHLSGHAEEGHAGQEAHMTFCYTDPVDREFFSTYLNEISIIGDGYYDDGTIKLYTVAYTGFAAELEARDHCFYKFLREFNEYPVLLKDQTVAHFLFDNVEQVALWGNCFGHKMESAEELKQSQ